MASLTRSLRLVTVNPQPERARGVVSKVAARLLPLYRVDHVANCEAESNVESTVQSLQPDLLLCASSWSPEQSRSILAAAKAARPTLLTYAAPHGLHGQGGPDAVAEHLSEKIKELFPHGESA